MRRALLDVALFDALHELGQRLMRWCRNTRCATSVCYVAVHEIDFGAPSFSYVLGRAGKAFVGQARELQLRSLVDLGERVAIASLGSDPDFVVEPAHGLNREAEGAAHPAIFATSSSTRLFCIVTTYPEGARYCLMSAVAHSVS
jgi:hypothetical protein